MLPRQRLKCGIVPHPLENEDLRQIYFLLTYACNKACPYCIEPNVHSGKYMSEKKFVIGMKIAKELDFKTLYLHGGEPTVHRDVVKYAKLAKDEGFHVNMFTNGIRQDVLQQLDGVVDEIRFSYEPGLEFMLQNQKEWKSRIKLYIMATTESYPTEESLMKVIDQALSLGMGVKVRTLNPVNPYAYKYQFVPYLHQRLLNMPEENIFCNGNKVAYRMENGVIVRLGNMQLNPGHLKYSVDPDGVMHSRFTHSNRALIVPEHEIEAEKMLFEPLIERLRNI
ncbi:MAG: radical SAM protein [Clostridia bacterium]|nr:radical SAM protein [Clostridia bacterium]